MAITTHLSQNQKRFLLERQAVSSDSQALAKIGLSRGLARDWKQNPEFKRAYDELMEKVTSAIENLNPEAFIEERLVPKALRRYDEILDTEIDHRTEAPVINAVANVAGKVLAGTGRLTPAETRGLSVSVIVAKELAEGAEYRAPWAGQTIESDGRAHALQENPIENREDTPEDESP
jgi:hypothetical protein